MNNKKKKKNNTFSRIIKLIVILILVSILIYLLRIASTTEKPKEKIEVAFENASYSCDAGGEIDIKINAVRNTFPDGVNIFSSDTNLALVNNNNGMNCDNCKRVSVICKSAGNVELKAVYNNETLATANLVVNPKKETLAFENGTYSCLAGEIFETTVKITEGMSSSLISAYSTSNSLVAKIDDNITSPATCDNCKKVRVLCMRYGNAELKAETVNGTKASAFLTVERGQGLLRFANSGGYICKKGQKINSAIIISNNTSLTKVDSNNSSIVTVESYQGVRPDYVNIVINCINTGTTTIFAEDINGFHQATSVVVQ